MPQLIPIAVRSSLGVSVDLGPPEYGSVQEFRANQSKSCRVMVFSSDGQYFAFIDGQRLKIINTTTWTEVGLVDNVKAYHLAFSPKGTYLMSWEPFTTNNANPEGSPNLKIYKSENGEFIKGFIYKKQTNWEPQWSADETLFSKVDNNSVVFYADLKFDEIAKRLNCHKVAAYSISPSVGNYFILCHMPGGQGQPSFGRLFKYPNFDAQQMVASKSFFQADRVEFYWNSKGSNALLLTIAEVDKTGSSYYGKQGLHFFAVGGHTCMVTLSKEGPIYSVSWSPKNVEFCVVYGFMPAKATLFNLKCEPIFEFGTGPRNEVHYNPHGNMLILGGFGNLRGHIEIWNMASKKIIGQCEAPETTLLQWAPDGVHFLTATTAPRLRIGNGYKIWHYSGSLLFQKPWNQQDELYDVCWMNYSKGVFKEPIISSERVEGIACNEPQASKQAYRPPSARNRPVVAFKLHDDEPACRPGGNPVPSKNAIKLKKNREAKKARKQEDKTQTTISQNEPNLSNVQITLTGDPDKDKKIRNIKKKLDAIAKLKEQQAQGKTLEINQLTKIKGEDDLLIELKQLQM